MDLVSYIHDAPLYRSVFGEPVKTRTYAIVCYKDEVVQAKQWFRGKAGQSPIMVVLDAGQTNTPDQLLVDELWKHPQLALIVFGRKGRQKAIALAAAGIREFAFDKDQNYSNHKFNPDILSKFLRRFERIFKKLADEESRLTFASLLKHRITGDHGYLRIAKYAQYEHHIVRAEPGEWVGDCGALTGTTALRFARKVGGDGRVFAFEPDPKNYLRLLERTIELRKGRARIEALNYGLSNQQERLSFVSGQDGASKFASTGDQEMPLDTLDNFAAAYELKGNGLLSFDIEGFEYQALQGGKQMIRDLRPKMQISLNHKGADLFRLPLWVMDNFQDCDVYIGHHSSHHSETDLYVMPHRPATDSRSFATKPQNDIWPTLANSIPAIWLEKSTTRLKTGFDPFLAERRFGCGLSPRVAPPFSIDQMVATLSKPDPVEIRYPIETFPVFLKRLAKRRRYGHIRIKTTGTPVELEARQTITSIAADARNDQITWMAHHMLRRAWTKKGFRERLCFFWGDHFTALGKTGVGSRGMSTYLESAIRPNIGGLFGDLLVAAVTHPIMQQYLDQNHSIGPNSSEAKAKRTTSMGLNENLAREVLELHTLGVDGPYSQADVTELAKLFAGLTFSFHKGFLYKPNFSEPGQKTVLGTCYGGGTKGQFEDVQAFLHALALHPVTAQYICEKIAAHFLGDDLDPELIGQMVQRYIETGGYLTEVYRSMLSHSSAWREKQGKTKNPFDFVSSSMRAVALDPKVVRGMSVKDIQLYLMHPMALMGQPWEEPLGPDGWPEDQEAWITPQGLAARIQWAMAVPTIFQPELPNAIDFETFALGPRKAQPLRSALKDVTENWEGVGLVLASPDFQTM